VADLEEFTLSCSAEQRQDADDRRRQSQLLAAIKTASLRLAADGWFVYKSEMLGYLPFCVDHWIEIGTPRGDW
jgi:hypothetical protein